MTIEDIELVRELRTHQLDSTMAHEAADRIETLSAENEQARMEERAAIVAWLRKDDETWIASVLADAIEAGEHLK